MTPTLSTRRQFLIASAALPFAFRGFAQPKPAHPKWVFLGTDTGEGIYRAPWDAATGELGKVELAAATDHPNFFALHPKLPVLYTTNESKGTQAAISSYRINTLSGELKPMQRVSSRADGPCYLSVDRTGRSAYVADYGGGGMAAYHLGPGGELSEATGGLNCIDNPSCGELGPRKDRQDAPHLHCATISPGNDFLLVCNLGDDAIELFPIRPGDNDPLGKPTRIAARAGSGPRHVAFHPNGRWVYCIHELDCTVDLYDWLVHRGAATMTLRKDSTISTLLPGTALEGNTGCEAVVSDDARFLYTCTRGVNSLTTYRIDAATGLLSEHQRLSCGGAIPRIIAFDPTRRWLLCCNQGSSTVTVFANDPATGKLSETFKTFAANTPMFTQFV